MSDRRGQVSALIASVLVVSALAGVGVVAGFTEAGLLNDSNLNEIGNEGEQLKDVSFIAICVVPELTRDELPTNGDVYLSLNNDNSIEDVFFDSDPLQEQSGHVEWTTNVQSEYFVIVKYGTTFEKFGPYQGPGTQSLVEGQGTIVTDVTANQPCGDSAFGVKYNFDGGEYDIVNPLYGSPA